MKKYSIIGMVLIFAGCELVVDVNVPVEKPTLTLNAFMIQDSVWSARLSLSRHILDETPYQTVTDGVVVVYHNGAPADTLTGDGTGLYVGDGIPVPGETYEIRAESAYGSVWSTSYLPLPAAISNVEVDIPANAGGNEPKINFRLHMKDRPEEKNFYQVLLIIARTQRNHQTGQEVTHKFPAYISSKDPAIESENGDSFGGVYFKDVLFDGKEITLPLESDYWGIGSGPVKLIFFLRTVSEDYYRYKTTAMLQNETSGNPFAQPVGVYNNIQNGFGIFGGFSQSVFEYEKK